MAKKTSASGKAPAAAKSAASAASDDDHDAGVASRSEGDDAGAEKEEEFDYELLEEGTIIDGVMYPDKEAKEGEEMFVYLTHAKAQQLQMGGVRLKRREPEPAASG